MAAGAGVPFVVVAVPAHVKAAAVAVCCAEPDRIVGASWSAALWTAHVTVAARASYVLASVVPYICSFLDAYLA